MTETQLATEIHKAAVQATATFVLTSAVQSRQ